MADNVARPHLLGLFRRASLDKTHDDHLLSTGCTSHPRSAVYSTLRASTPRCTCGRDARQLAPRLLFMHNTVGERRHGGWVTLPSGCTGCSTTPIPAAAISLGTRGRDSTASCDRYSWRNKYSVQRAGVLPSVQNTVTLCNPEYSGLTGRAHECALVAVEKCRSHISHRCALRSRDRFRVSCS